MKISAMAGSGAGCPAILAGAVNLACFLRNTNLKSVLGTCGNGASSLRVRPHSIMSVVRRRGHPRVALSGLTDRTEWQAQVWQSKLGRSQGAKSSSGWRGARGSSIGAGRTRRIRNPLTINNVWRFKMKMVKSLLLGTAAGLVAMSGAQAADLPVKAKPVEYVKICSLYGVGFYYIPGTDMCLKVGGWARFEIGQGYNGSLTNEMYNNNLNNRTTADHVWRVKGNITLDARSPTEYGTVRSYIDVGVSTSQIGNGTGATTTDDFANYANRWFIQWAGFTIGRSTSFYDFYS